MEKPTLHSFAQSSEDVQDFISEIHLDALNGGGSLLDQLYEWENSTRENRSRFEHMGWLSMAGVYYSEMKEQA